MGPPWCNQSTIAQVGTAAPPGKRQRAGLPTGEGSQGLTPCGGGSSSPHPPPTSLCHRKWRRGPSGWLLASLGPASLLPPPVALISTEGLPAPLRLGSTAARRAGLWDSLWIRVHSSEGPRAPRSLLSSQAQPLLEQPYVRPTLPSVPTRVHRLPGPQSEDGETSTGLAGFMFPGGHTLYPGGQLDKPGARILRLGWL